MLLKDTWTNKDQSDAEAKPLYPYLFELKNILAESGGVGYAEFFSCVAEEQEVL